MDVPIYYNFRYTIEPTKKDSWTAQERRVHLGILEHFITVLKPYLLSSPKLTSGVEYLNGKAESSFAHLHIAFTSTSTRDAIHKQLNRKSKDEWGIELKGPKVYALKPDIYVVEEKFFRYPLKQGLEKVNQIGFGDAELERMHQNANDCWKIACEINQAKQSHKDEDTTLYDRLLKRLQDNNVVNRTEVGILTQIIEFYREEKRPINRTTAVGYKDLAMLDLGIITAEELARNMLR